MTGITQVATIFLPVSVQERALDFYVGTLGFTASADFPYGHGLRWVEVQPAGAEHALALVPVGEGVASTTDRAVCALVTDDIVGVHELLLAAGVPVDEAVAGKGTPRAGLVSLEVQVPDPVPAQFFFRDPD